MILYTAMPQELIFQATEEEYSKQTIINYEGIPLLVEKDEQDQYRVMRVMSSDPSHYLNERYCPGAIIEREMF